MTTKTYVLAICATLIAAMSVPTPIAAITAPSPTKPVIPKLSPTSTAAPTPIPDVLDNSKTATVNQNLKRMIDKVVEQNKEKVKARLQEVGSRRRGFLGEVKNIREGAITVRARLGTQVIPTDQGVEMLRAGKPVTADKISVGDWAVVIGATKDDAFIAETIEFLTTSPQPKSQIVQLGTIIGNKKTTLTFKPRQNDAEEKTFSLIKNTQYLDFNGEKTAAVNFSANVQTLLIAQQDENGATVVTIKALAPFTKAEATKAATKN